MSKSNWREPAIYSVCDQEFSASDIVTDGVSTDFSFYKDQVAKLVNSYRQRIEALEMEIDRLNDKVWKGYND